ncbi:Endonuclease/exonuclease/phosphatase [Naviculisporaceae sp. PSN 640]
MKRNHEISPPPLKRRKVAASPSSEEVATMPTSQSARQTIRLFSWNINGIDAFLPSSSTKITTFFKPSNSESKKASPTYDGPTGNSHEPSLRTFLRRHNWPEILFLQEIKLKQGDTKREASLLATLSTPLSPTGDGEVDEARIYTVHTSLPRDKYNVKGFGGKLYGVATIMRRDFAQRHVQNVRYPDWDLEGRVSIVEMKNNDNSTFKPLAILNIYAVNGTSAPYRSPQSGLVIGTRHDHKLAFHIKLRDECHNLESKGFHVVVAGDLNIARGLWDGYPNLRTFPKQHCLNRADFNAKFFGEEDNIRAGAYVLGEERKEKQKCLDAVDVYRGLYGDRRKYTYFSRNKEWGSSCDRVDLIFVSGDLWKEGRVVGADILDSPIERGPSDHVPIWVEIAMD